MGSVSGTSVSGNTRLNYAEVLDVRESFAPGGAGVNPFGADARIAQIGSGLTVVYQSGSAAEAGYPRDVSTAEGDGIELLSDTADKYINITYALPYPMLIRELGAVVQADGAATGYVQATVGLYASINSGFGGTVTISKGISVNTGSGKNNPQANGLLNPIMAGTTPTNLWTNAGSLDLATTLFTHVRLQVTPAAGSKAKFTFVRFFVNPARKSRVVITVDDGYMTNYTYLGHALQKRGLKMSMGMIPAQIEALSASYLMDAQVQALIEQGHEVITHGPYAGGTGALTDFGTAAEAAADAEACRDYLDAAGYFSNDWQRQCYIWPKGEFQYSSGDTTILDAMKAAGFTTGRTTVSYIPYSHRYWQSTTYGGLLAPIIGGVWPGGAAGAVLTSTTTALDYAADNGLDAIVMLHAIDLDSASTTGAIRISELNTLLDSVATNVRGGKQECVLFSELARG